VDTLPPEMKKPFKTAVPPSNGREEVVAAIGKPEHKVREREFRWERHRGLDLWPAALQKPFSIRFMGDRVTSIRQYPQYFR